MLLPLLLLFTQTVRQQSQSSPEELKPFVSDIFGKAQATSRTKTRRRFSPRAFERQQLAQLLHLTQTRQHLSRYSRAGTRSQTRPLFEEATHTYQRCKPRALPLILQEVACFDEPFPP